MSFCMRRNLGMAIARMMESITAMTTTASTMIQLMARFVRETMTMPPTARIGA